MDSFRYRKLGAWPALFAMVLYALWPLLATAQPRDPNGHYELCPHMLLHNASHQMPEQAPAPDPGWGDHQLKCAFSAGAGDGSSPLADVVVVPAITHWDTPALVASPGVPRSFFRTYAAVPRGPPHFF